MSFSLNKYFKVLDEILGDPGCPWSKEQTISTICHYVIEEAYEVLDAEKKGEPKKVLEELGDLYFTVTFLTQLILKKYKSTFEQVVEKGCDKMIRRSPHVFENPGEISLEELRGQWEALKAKERQHQKEDPTKSIAPSLPLIIRAMKWIELAHKYGYEEKLDEDSLGDAFLKLIAKGSNSYQNVGHIFEDRLKDFEVKFTRWMEENSPEKK